MLHVRASVGLRQGSTAGRVGARRAHNSRSVACNEPGQRRLYATERRPHAGVVLSRDVGPNQRRCVAVTHVHRPWQPQSRTLRACASQLDLSKHRAVGRHLVSVERYFSSPVAKAKTSETQSSNVPIDKQSKESKENKESKEGKEGKEKAKDEKTVTPTEDAPKVKYWAEDYSDTPPSKEDSRPLPERVLATVKGVGKSTLTIITHPQQIPGLLRNLWADIKHSAKHYYNGTRLLWLDVKTLFGLLRKVVGGYGLSRREKQQMVRTTTDLFRLVPFSLFVIIPAAELALPLALKLFPNMLPTTYRENHQAEASVKKELQARLALARHMQAAAEKMAEAATSKDGLKESASKLKELIANVRKGKRVDAESIVRISKLFSDEMTLLKLNRAQLVSMCRYMNVSPYGTSVVLRRRLEDEIQRIKEDDRLIVEEGLETLTREELQEACRERGMRAHGLTVAGYRRNLRQWMKLSLDQNVPTTLLILSRAFSVQEQKETAEDHIQTALSSLDDVTVEDVVSESTHSQDFSERIDAILRENERIAVEEIENELERKAQDMINAARKEGKLQTIPVEEMRNLTQSIETLISGKALESEKKNLRALRDELRVVKENRLQLEEEEQKKAEKRAARDAKLAAAAEAIADQAGAQGIDFVAGNTSPAAPMDSGASDAAARDKPAPAAEPSKKPSVATESETKDEASVPETPKKIELERPPLGDDHDDEPVKDQKTKEEEVEAEEDEHLTEQEQKDMETSQNHNTILLNSVSQKLETMIQDLEIRMEAAEKSIGTKLAVLDENADGLVTEAELLHVCAEHLATDDLGHDMVQEVLGRLSAEIRKRPDGSIPLEELSRIAERFRLEIEKEQRTEAERLRKEDAARSSEERGDEDAEDSSESDGVADTTTQSRTDASSSSTDKPSTDVSGEDKDTETPKDKETSKRRRKRQKDKAKREEELVRQNLLENLEKEEEVIRKKLEKEAKKAEKKRRKQEAAEASSSGAETQAADDNTTSAGEDAKQQAEQEQVPDKTESEEQPKEESSEQSTQASSEQPKEQSNEQSTQASNEQPQEPAKDQTAEPSTEKSKEENQEKR